MPAKHKPGHVALEVAYVTLRVAKNNVPICCLPSHLPRQTSARLALPANMTWQRWTPVAPQIDWLPSVLGASTGPPRALLRHVFKMSRERSTTPHSSPQTGTRLLGVTVPGENGSSHPSTVRGCDVEHHTKLTRSPQTHVSTRVHTCPPSTFLGTPPALASKRPFFLSCYFSFASAPPVESRQRGEEEREEEEEGLYTWMVSAQAAMSIFSPVKQF